MRVEKEANLDILGSELELELSFIIGNYTIGLGISQVFFICFLAFP